MNIRLSGLLQSSGIPGACVPLVTSDSVISTSCFGLADIETDEPVSDSTLFCVGSCTKSFLGLGFLKLIEQDAIDIHAPVSDIVPDIPIVNPWSSSDPVLVVHLLEHTSGFDDIHPNSLVCDDPEMPLREALLMRSASRRVRWKPGTRRAYSSPGYTLAGYALEKVSGRRYEEFLKEEILNPIGMSTSTLRLTEETKGLLATGYDDQNRALPYIQGYDRPSSSLMSSGREMARFVRFLLNDGKIEDSQIIDGTLMSRLGVQTMTLAARAGLTMGYAFGVGARFGNGITWLGHSGGGPGCMAKYAYSKATGSGYVILANSFRPSVLDEISELLQDYLTRGIHSGPGPTATLPSQTLRGYAGYYELRNPRLDLVSFIDVLFSGTTISAARDTLWRQDFLGEKDALIPVSATMFRRRDEPGPSSVFLSTPTGERVFATSGSYFLKTGAWKPYVYRAMFFGAVVLMASSVIHALFWVPSNLYRRFRRSEKRPSNIKSRAFPLLAVLCLVCGLVVVAMQSPLDVGRMTINNIVFFVSTLLFAALALASLIIAIAGLRKRRGRVAQAYALLVSGACAGMAAFLGYWGIIGLRLWAY